MKRFPEGMKTVSVSDCRVGEDLVLTSDGKRWYLTCMGSNNLIVGDAKTDEPLQTIAAPFSETPYIQYPHGIALQEHRPSDDHCG